MHTNTPVERFNLEHLASMMTGKGDDKIEKCQEYIRRYFYWTDSGLFHYDTKRKAFVPVIGDELKNRLPDGIKIKHYDDTSEKMKTWKARKWLEDEVFERYDIVSKLGQPPVDNKLKTINMMPAPMHEATGADESTYAADVDETVKAKVRLMLDHIRDVWCSGNEKQYEYVMNWLSCTGRRKLKSALYLQSLEQTGKTLVIEFLEDYVFGKQLVYMTSSMEVINQYTAPLEGKILVNINEMPCASTGEWRKLMNKLKSLITDSTFDCRQMYCNPRVGINTFNIILTSNNDAIAIDSTNNQRYKCLDVSNGMIGNTAYFNKLCGACFNPEAGRAFYLLLKERFADKGRAFDPTSFPVTAAFTDKMCHRLELVYEFLKDKYVKQNTDLRESLGKLYEQYTGYCQWLRENGKMQGRKELTDKQFSKKLRELRCVKDKRERVPEGRRIVFRASAKELYSEFESKGYIHELDGMSAQYKPAHEGSDSDSDSDDSFMNDVLNAGEVDVDEDTSVESSGFSSAEET